MTLSPSLKGVRIEKACDVCGTIMRLVPSLAKRQRLCSPQCVGKVIAAKLGKSDEQFIADFWTRVEKTESCWLWQGAKKHDGYGLICRRGKMIQAHRFSWELSNGPIPSGLCALHRCDTPACVNPAHLFLGTRQDNADDAVAKGRQACGERNKKNKLTATQVIEIRQRIRWLNKRKTNAAELAKEYGVSRGSIIKAAMRDSWKHLP